MKHLRKALRVLGVTVREAPELQRPGRKKT
jgi:hypothetical protein